MDNLTRTESISFDGVAWLPVAQHSIRNPHSGNNAGCLANLLGLGGAGTLLVYLAVSRGSIPPWAWISTACIVAATISLYFYLENAADSRSSDWLHSNIKESTHQLKINDVQRVDTRAQVTVGSGGGLGVELGFGLIVGGGQAGAVTNETTIVGWQFYTDIGILVVTDTVYNGWLNAGRPNRADYMIVIH